MPLPARRAGGAALATGILAALAAAWSLVVFARNLDVFALGLLAPGYRPALLTVSRVSQWPFGALVEGTAEGSPFAEAYVVRAAAAVREIFTPLVTEFFTGRPGWSVETRGGTMLLCRYAETVAPGDVQALVARCDEVRQVLAGGRA